MRFKFNLVIYLLLMNILNVKAGYNDIFWKPSSGGVAPSVVISPFASDKYTTDITVTPLNKDQTMLASDSECVDFPPVSGGVTNELTQWLMIPNKGVSPGGINYTINMTEGLVNAYPSPQLGTPSGFTLVSYSKIVKNESASVSCFNKGTWAVVRIPSASPLRGVLTLDPRHARPGHYSFPIEMIWALGENKFFSGTPGTLWQRAGAMMSGFPRVNPIVTFDVVSKCDVSTKDILLHHGTISLESNNSTYRSGSADLTITCTRSSPLVYVKITGVDPVSGKTANYTQCGKGGDCRITFDARGSHDAFNQRFTVSDGSPLNLNIKSDYIPSSTPQAGHFTGSAILTITII